MADMTEIRSEVIGVRASGGPPPPDLQAVFPDPIASVRVLTPGYSGHASDVWLVTTATERVVVRASRASTDTGDDGRYGPFWWGCRRLFGIDPGRLADLEPVNAALRALSTVPAPRVLRHGVVGGRPCAVVEYMPGRPVDSFTGAPQVLLADLGTALAHIHAGRLGHCGSPGRALRYPREEFPARLAATMREMIERFSSGDARMRSWADAAIVAAGRLRPPTGAALVMLDMDPTQFLAEGGRLTAIIDTEAYAAGPPEWDLVALEYVLDARGAATFARAYAAIAPLPGITAVRLPYRFLARLLEIQGAVDVEPWMAWPHVFD